MIRKLSTPQLCRPLSASRLRSVAALCVALFALLLALPLRGMAQQKSAQPAGDPHGALHEGGLEDQALATAFAGQDRTAFQRDLKLDEFRELAIQHLDQIKIIDSWARQSLRTIMNKQSLDGRDSVELALDMALRPEAWLDKNIIYVQSVPIRDELSMFVNTVEERKRIHEKGTVSFLFLHRKEVEAKLEDLSIDSRQLKAVNKVKLASATFQTLFDSLTFLPPAADQRQMPWFNPAEIDAALTAAATAQAAASAPAPASRAFVPPIDTEWHYNDSQQLRAQLAFRKIVAGWRGNDVALVNQALAEFNSLAPSIDPQGYPTATRRHVELLYNRSFSGTLVAFVYFAAMVLFFLAAIGITKRLGRSYKIALGIFSFALACHITAMGVRWWISGRIPIQNQFESVMGSACIGCVIGLALELWKRNGIFGAAFSFVGFIAATALLAAPYVFGTNVGADPGKVAGVLANTFWLYIHVNIVISSYALILASAAIALVYLGLRQWHWINPIEPGFEETGGDGGGTSGSGPKGGARTLALTADAARVTAQRATLLETLDQANLVILQMAFWALGVGIMCGAVWADQSWGRPWGWDPKETFALVTWIVYLIIVHVRLVAKWKADTTAWLSLFGCATMLFNWIGVNFFLVGLHSYA